jgi:hypothetical protein
VETISASTVLERVLSMSRRRRAVGSLVPAPQAIHPVDDDEFQVLETFPWRMAVHATFELGIEELLSVYEEAFVRQSYRRILLRDPWPHEVRRWIERLSMGWPRTMVVAGLRFSDEGRRAGVVVRGLWLRAAMAIPLMFFRRMCALARGHR